MLQYPQHKIYEKIGYHIERSNMIANTGIMIQEGVLNMDFTDKLDILYARRSSEDGKDGESIENQVALLKQYAADKGYYNIKVVTDDGYTGTNFVEVR